MIWLLLCFRFCAFTSTLGFTESLEAFAFENASAGVRTNNATSIPHLTRNALKAKMTRSIKEVCVVEGTAMSASLRADADSSGVALRKMLRDVPCCWHTRRAEVFAGTIVRHGVKPATVAKPATASNPTVSVVLGMFAFHTTAVGYCG